MSNSIFTLQDFLAQAESTNFARANRFEIVIHPPMSMQGPGGGDQSNIAIMIEDAALPGKSIGTSKLRLHGLDEHRARTVDFFGEAINFTFYVDDSWNIKKFFEQWQELMIDSRSREVGFYKDYVGAIELRTLSVNDDLRHSVLLEEAFPRSFQLIQIAQGSNAVQRFVVAITFKRWRPLEYTGGVTAIPTISASGVPSLTTDPAPVISTIKTISATTVFKDKTNWLIRQINKASEANSIIQSSLNQSPFQVATNIADDLGIPLPSQSDVSTIQDVAAVAGLPLPRFPL